MKRWIVILPSGKMHSILAPTYRQAYEIAARLWGNSVKIAA